MDLFAIFFTRFTSSVSSEILPQLNLFIAMRPRDSLALLHNYINCKGADESIFNAFLVNYYSFFNADFIAKFATAMSHAMETHPFVDNYKQAYNQVFLKAVDQSDYTVVKFAYFDPKAPFNYNTLLLHLRDPELSKYALQIASRVQLPKSKSYFEAFFNLAQHGNRLAVLTMCTFMSFSADRVKMTTELQ